MAAYVACGASVTATLTADGGTGSTVDMAATIVGSATLTASLSDGAVPEIRAGKPGGRWFWGASLVPPKPPTTVVSMAAHIVGTSTITADLDFTIDFDDELRQLMLLGVV